MPTAAFNKFEPFIENAFEGVHNFQSDTFKFMLTNVAPVATNGVKADLTEIAAGNGYTAGGAAVTVSASSQTGGTYTATLTGNVVFTASGGNIASFRYAVLYNDTPASPLDPLVGFFDYGSSISPSAGETFTINSNGVNIISAS